jgi:hypothetical protein
MSVEPIWPVAILAQAIAFVKTVHSLLPILHGSGAWHSKFPIPRDSAMAAEDVMSEISDMRDDGTPPTAEPLASGTVPPVDAYTYMPDPGGRDRQVATSDPGKSEVPSPAPPKDSPVAGSKKSSPESEEWRAKFKDLEARFQVVTELLEQALNQNALHKPKSALKPTPVVEEETDEVKRLTELLAKARLAAGEKLTASQARPGPASFDPWQTYTSQDGGGRQVAAEAPVSGDKPKEDHITLVDPKSFAVKVLDTSETLIKYREWARTLKRFIKTRPKVGQETLQAIAWAETQGQKTISKEVLDAYPDQRVQQWDGEIMNLILKYVEGHLQNTVSESDTGLEAWRRVMWFFEPRLASRAQMYLGQFMSLSEVASDKLVPGAMNNLEHIVRQYEETSGKILDSEQVICKLTGILPKDLRAKVRTKLDAITDYGHAVRLIMEELQDFTTGRVPVQENSKTPLSSMGKNSWEESWAEDWEVSNEQVESQYNQVNIDSIKGKGKSKGKSGGKGFSGDCHYCGIFGHRANECNKKTADMKAKGIGREAPGYKGYKGQGSWSKG